MPGTLLLLLLLLLLLFQNDRKDLQTGAVDEFGNLHYDIDRTSVDGHQVHVGVYLFQYLCVNEHG